VVKRGEASSRRPAASRARAALAAAVTALAAACGGPADDAGTPSGRGGTAVFGVFEDVDSFSEFTMVSLLANQIADHMLFLTLLRYDADLRLQPRLAESWELADDASSVTFRLRPDVRWHDGRPVTAGDVLFTYRTAVHPETAYPQGAFFRMVEGAEALDSLTVRFTFRGRHAEPLDPFTEWCVMPAHLLAGVPPAELANAAFNRAPVGNGPFRFESWRAGQSISFVANEEFPEELGGRPQLDRVLFRIVPEQTTLLTELRSGTVDLVRAIPPQEAAAIDADPNLRIVAYPDRSFVYVAWNTRDPLFEDPLVRQALSLAIDRGTMVEALLYDFAEPAVSYVLPDVAPWAVDPELEPLPYAPDSARALLAAAGWRDADGDGVLDRGGRPFRFSLKTNQGNDLRSDLAVVIQSDLRKVGVEAVPQLVEWTTFLDQINGKQFQAYVSSWVYDSFRLDPSDVFHSRAIDAKYNRSSYANPAVDSLIDAALAEPDRDAARPLWHRFQRIVRDEAPYTFLFNDRERVGVSERLQGVEMDARGYLATVAEWRVAGPGAD
jgi:peptide/nickel transport system substrate-binding protein